MILVCTASQRIVMQCSPVPETFYIPQSFWKQNKKPKQKTINQCEKMGVRSSRECLQASGFLSLSVHPKSSILFIPRVSSGDTTSILSSYSCSTSSGIVSFWNILGSTGLHFNQQHRPGAARTKSTSHIELLIHSMVWDSRQPYIVFFFVCFLFDA